MDPDEKYRDYLVSTKQKSQKAYDDGILKVCGGSLGVSFAFVSNFVDGPPVLVWLLLLAWACWGLALVGVIASHRYSTLAADAAIAAASTSRLVGLRRSKPDDTRPNRIVKTLNRFGWCLFALGVVLLGAFVYFNMEGGPMAKRDSDTGTESKPTTPADTSRDPLGGGSGKAQERGHDIIPPPAGGTQSSQDTPSSPSRGGGDRGTRRE